MEVEATNEQYLDRQEYVLEKFHANFESARDRSSQFVSELHFGLVKCPSIKLHENIRVILFSL